MLPKVEDTICPYCNAYWSERKGPRRRRRSNSLIRMSLTIRLPCGTRKLSRVSLKGTTRPQLAKQA